ncbi:hypothetical protein HMPREF1986_00956 [Oribacterium sp. oral taxon 078 str. F0263]|nr:hypothetical protein HMPREF1986_00956 [Oribacterium sp. oral taxon 078 str. F0263]
MIAQQGAAGNRTAPQLYPPDLSTSLWITWTNPMSSLSHFFFFGKSFPRA